MDLHYLLKFLHVVAAILWVGGGTLLVIGGLTAARARDGDAAAALNRVGATIGPRLFSPAGVVVLVTGIAMIWTGGLPLAAWLVLSLIAIAGSILTGALLLGPLTEKARDAVDPALAAAITQRFLRIGLGDVVVLFTIVWLMVLRPGWSDLATLLPAIIAGLVGAALILRAVARPA